MEEVRAAQIRKENVFLRGFGTFLIKHRKEKTARNITKNTTLKIPAHDSRLSNRRKDSLSNKVKNYYLIDCKRVPLSNLFKYLYSIAIHIISSVLH